jgi:hypothetical protein
MGLVMGLVMGLIMGLNVLRYSFKTRPAPLG